MASIDDKVVSMSFESSKFESGVNKTLSSLDKLKAALHFPNAGKGFDDINKSAKAVDMSHIAKGVDDIKGKLGALSVAALAVFAQIAQKAVAAGANLVKAFTIDPIKAGFQEYATNLNAIQTILANTQVSGATLKDVNAALQDLNHYSDKTIYNFSQMAKNIGTFTAAGVDLKTSTQAIKGIANLAALSGSNADQAATAMYQLSQAISAGSVKLQDWNSVVNAGMGGTVFQRALAQTAVAMGTLDSKAVTLTGKMKNVAINGEAFRQSLSTPGKASWLTSKVLTQTLKQFTGDLSNAQLAAMGFNNAQIKAIQQTAKTAMHAATEVKTLSQVFDVAKETAGSGWAQTFQIIFGNFTEAKGTFTALSNTINGFINTNAEARNKVLADWKKLGGRTVLISGIKTAFQNLGEVLKPIKQAFRDIFPATTGKNLFDLTVKFKQFAEALKPSEETVANLRRTFRGLFAVLDIAKQVIGGILGVFGHLVGVTSENSGGFLNLTGNIGDFLVSVDDALKKGGRLNSFFSGLGHVLEIPMRVLGAFKDLLTTLFIGFSPGGFSDKMNNATGAITPFEKALQGLKETWDNVLSSMGDVGKAFKPVVDAFVQLLQGLGPALGKAAANMNFEAILQVIRTGLLTGLVLMLKQFLGKGSAINQITKGFGGGILNNISGSFKALQGSMVAMQQNIKAKTLKEIAIAIALLTASVVALSFVDPKRLTSALTAMTIGFGQLMGAMFVLTNITKTTGFVKMPFIAASLVILAGAIDVLSIAVIAMGQLSWNELIKGLSGVAVLLVGISLAAVPLSANSAGLIRAGVGLTAMAVALRILANAVAAFGSMSWATIGKGMVSIAIGLTIMIAAMRGMPPNMVLTGAGLVAVAVGLRLLANVVQTFGGMDWGTIGKGMAGISAGLVIIALAMRLMPNNMILTGAGLLVVAVALQGIVRAVKSMGGMSVGELAKGLIGLAASLVILAVALTAMSGTIGGAIALGIAAAGLSLLARALVILGKQSWTQIIKGLATLAGALIVMGVAGALITPVIPSLLAFGAALLLIGAGLALAGAGIFLIGTGLSALVVALPTGIGIIVAAAIELAKALPKIVEQTILGLLEIVKSLSVVAPQFVDALVKILDSLIQVIIEASPKIRVAFAALLTAALGIIADNQDKIIQAGLSLVVALIQGIRNNIGMIVQSAVSLIGRFLTAIASNISKVIHAAVQIPIAIIRGIGQYYSAMATAGLTILTKFLGAIARNLGRVVAAGLSIVVKLVGAIASNLGRLISAGTNAILAFINGVGNAGPRIISAATNAMIKFINAMSKNSVKLADAGAKAIIAFLNGVAAVIRTREPEMIAAGANIGKAIVQGMIQGMASLAPDLVNKAASMAKDAVGSIAHHLHLRSPSKVTFEMGQLVVAGLALGIADHDMVLKATSAMGMGVITTLKDVFEITSPSKVMRDIGRDVTAGFAQGLKKGTQDDIRQAFAEMKQKLNEEMSNLRSTIASEQSKLKELRQADKRDAGAIREAKKALAISRTDLANLEAGHKALTKTLQKQKVELLGLAKQYADVGTKLDDAKTSLEDLKKIKADATTGFAEQFGALPDVVMTDAEGSPIDPGTQLTLYLEALKHQSDAVGAYNSTLQQLRTLGLDDQTYQKLLREGTADQAFADQLLAGGATAVSGLNTLDAQLKAVSDTLANNAGSNLYQAGIDAAQGLVNGLQSQEDALAKAMEKLANAMIRALKKKLKIKSPSQEFAEIGKFSMEGMAQGFSDSSKIVTDAIDAAANDALTAMQQSMRDISQAVTDELNPSPVITPILDLTRIREQSGELAGLTNVVPITAAASYGQASAISADQARVLAEQAAVVPGGTAVKFEQNNYSPESLSEIDIYRQTRNQLSQLKTVLTP